MTETLVQWFVENLGGSAAKELVIFIISMIPILELRGGLLAAGPAFLDVAGHSYLYCGKSDSCSLYLTVYHGDFQLAEKDKAVPPHGGKAGKPGDE